LNGLKNMADYKKVIKEYLKKKLKEQGIDVEDFNFDKPQPVMDMRKKQGGGMWQSDIGEGEETEEEKKKREKREGK